MPFAFSNLRMWDYPWTTTDYKVADAMTTYWTNVAKTLSPNSAALPRWAVYSPKDEYWLNSGDTTRMEKFSTARIDFIAGLQEAARKGVR